MLGNTNHYQEVSIAKVTFGNHSALRVRPAELERIQSFYRDVFGCRLTRSFGDKDDFRMEMTSTLHLYASAASADKGATYGALDALTDDEFMKAIFLELKTGDMEEMRKKIIAFGVRVLNVPDPHLYFQAPGGQIFRLVGSDEDLSKYEGTS